MTPHDLIAAFDVLADAPDGVKRLRELVLSLAVRGKLVAQEPGDEPATTLIDRVSVEKRRLYEDGRIKRPGEHESIAAGDAPFEVPVGWAWARCDELFVTVTDGDHQPPPRAKDGVPFLVIGDVSSGQLDFSATRFVPHEYFNGLHWTRQPAPGDVLYTVTGSFGITLTVEVTRPFCVQRHIAILKKSCDTDSAYLRLVLSSPDARRYAEETATGTAQKTVSLKSLRSMPLPIAPLAEQRRIVARVDELMGLLDRLDAARATRDAVRRAARDAALADLRDAPDAEAVEAAWSRIARQMDDLFAEPEDVAPLRQAVLQLAVRGRLVEQDPEDEPASTLLERVVATQASLVKKRLARKPKVSGAPFSDECPFDLPPRWVWCRLGQVLRTCSNGISVSPNDNGAGFPLLRISAATGKPSWLVDVEDHRFGEVPRSRAESYFVEAGDLLACRFNGNLHYVGAVAQVPPFAGGPYMHPDKLIRLQSIEVDHRYLVVAINAETTRAQVREVAATTAGNIGINGKQLQGLCIPLPPLNEQTRIAAKVDALMALCDDLEARLTATRDLHAQFAAAAVHHLDV